MPPKRSQEVPLTGPVPAAGAFEAGATMGAPDVSPAPLIDPAVFAEGVALGLAAHTAALEARQRAQEEAARLAEQARRRAVLAHASAMPAVLDPSGQPYRVRTAAEQAADATAAAQNQATAANTPAAHLRETGSIKGTPFSVVRGTAKAGPGTASVDVVVAGGGFIGTSAEAKREREPHALNTVEAVNIPDTGIAFKGLMGRVRRRAVGRYIGSALQGNTDAGVRQEGAASVVHARSPAAGLAPETARQQGGVRKANKLLAHQAEAEARKRESEYVLRAAVREAVRNKTLVLPEAVDVARLTGTALLYAARQIKRPDGDTKKARRVAEGFYDEAQQHELHAEHKLHTMAEGTDARGQVTRRTVNGNLGQAGRILDKQGRVNRKAAARAAQRATPPPRP